MSTYLAERIEKPAHFSISPLVRGRGKRAVHVIGFDSEQDTTTGRPMLFQFSKSGEADACDLYTIDARKPRHALETFMRYVHTNCTRKDTEYIIVGFNLKYEFTQLFGDIPTELNTLDEYEFRYEGRDAGETLKYSFVVRVMASKRYGVVMMNETTHRRIRLIDAAAFWSQMSLDSVGAMLGVGRKETVASKKFTRKDLLDETFLSYSRQDAYLTRLVGEYIVDLHETYDVPTCLTAPHFAARVFRRHFLSGTVALPDPDLEQAGLFSYHGGKNGYYLDGPKFLPGVYAFDITSAYPEAMRQLPNIQTAEWKWANEYVPGAHALWRVSGKYRSCTYRGIMHHGNGFHASGDIHDTWTTSYELAETLAQGEIEITACVGWIMDGEQGGPLAAYVDRFFEMKRTATGAARNAAKLFLNSLYGKFFQKVPLGIVGYYDAESLDDAGQVTYVETDPSQMFDYQAGGLYHPPIASLITGFVRAKIHRLEHKYDAIMTSTDGFFALNAPDPADIGTDLGMLTVERGDLSIWRERLYDFQPSDPDSKPKYALHGFRGRVGELRQIPLAPGAYAYTAQQVITNKQATRAYAGQRFAPGMFAQLVFTLDLSSAKNSP